MSTEYPSRFEVKLQTAGNVLLVFYDEQVLHDGLSGSSSVKRLPFPAPSLST